MRKTLMGCYGTSKKSGKRVGRNHRWGTTGGMKPRAGDVCEFCGRFFEHVQTVPPQVFQSLLHETIQKVSK